MAVADHMSTDDYTHESVVEMSLIILDYFANRDLVRQLIGYDDYEALS